MPRNRGEEEVARPKPLGILVEIRGPGDEFLAFPATIQNFAAGLVTLEVEGYYDGPDTATLVGRGGSLRLPPTAAKGSLTLPGIVTWARNMADEGDCLNMGLRLNRISRATTRVLEEYLPQRQRDIQGLWERWEEARAKPTVREMALAPMPHFLAGLGLVVGGLILQFNWSQFIQLFGAAVAVYGCVVMGGTALKEWRRKRRKAI